MSMARWVQHRHRLPGAVPALVGIAALSQAIRLGVWADGRPGPGLWPLLASVVLIAAAVVVVVQSDRRDVEGLLAGELRRVGLGVALLALFAVMFILVGVVSAAFVVALLWLRLLARESWRTSVLVAAAAAATLYLVFVWLLAVPLPLDAFLPR